MTRFEFTIRFLFGLMITMAIAIAYIAYVVFASSTIEPLVLSESPTDAPRAPVIPCDPASFAADNCPVGHVCVGRNCVVDEPRQICDEGEPCDDCECADDLVCYLHRCRREPPPPSDVCFQEAVREAMLYLARECNRAADDRAAILSTLSCSSDDWQKLAIDRDKLDTILAAFPDRMSIHFSKGAPRSPSSLPAAERAHYVARLRGHREALGNAKQVLIIGRSSPEGDPGANYELALRRIDAVTAMIREVLGEAGEPAKAVPLRAWSLASESPITPSQYRKFYARTSITGSAGDDLRLVNLLDRELDPRHLSDWRWLYETINRVVLVVPIPCDGTEWDPAALASFQGDPRDG